MKEGKTMLKKRAKRVKSLGVNLRSKPKWDMRGGRKREQVSGSSREPWDLSETGGKSRRSRSPSKLSYKERLTQRTRFRWGYGMTAYEYEKLGGKGVKDVEARLETQGLGQLELRLGVRL